MNSLMYERLLRSIGLFTEDQLCHLQRSKVAVAGLGLGGSVFINLARLGVQNFHVADPDIYERTNINRQRLAKESTIGERKDDCLIQEARDINPQIQIASFRDGVQFDNVAFFLNGVDVIIDAVDLFALPQKICLHQEARKRKIPVVSIAMVAFGGTMIVFDENSPPFEELCGYRANESLQENLSRFFSFLAPEVPECIQEPVQKVLSEGASLPFVVPGCELTASLATTEVARLLMGWQNGLRAPQGTYVDPLKRKFQVYDVDYRLRSHQLPSTKKAA